jgi:hypothetical protein
MTNMPHKSQSLNIFLGNFIFGNFIFVNTRTAPSYVRTFHRLCDFGTATIFKIFLLPNLGMLTLQETNDIFLYFTAKQKPPLEYESRPRRGLMQQPCHRFGSSAYRSNQWRYRGRCDAIQFSVDKRIFIVGFGLYGSSNGSSDYSARIELKNSAGGRSLASNTQQFFSDGSSNTFHVFFDQPVQIEPDICYVASAILDGAELSYFGQDGMSEMTVGNVTFQFQCSSESTNGTGVQGGQIPELVFYGPTASVSNSGTLVRRKSSGALTGPENVQGGSTTKV